MKTYLLLTLFICSIIANASTNDIFFERISPESGFTFNNVSSITEDEHGLLWFSCNNRLYHYNTTSIEEYSIYNDTCTFSNPTIQHIVDDKDHMKICTSSGLYHFNKADKSFHKQNLAYPDGTDASNDRINSLTCINDLKSIIVIEQKAYILSNGNSNISKLSPQKDIEQVTFVSYVEDKVLIGTKRGKVYTTDSELTEPNLLYHAPKKWIRSILKDGNKYLLGYHNAGIDIINLFGIHIESYSETANGANKIPNNMIRQIIKRENGDIWIATFEGILIKNKNGITLVNSDKNKGLAHNSIYSLFQGKNNGIWIGTWAGGISYFRDCNYKFKHLKPHNKDGIEINSSITSFTEDESGNIWIASGRGSENLFKGPLASIEQIPCRAVETPSHNFFPKDLKYLSENKLAILDFEKGLVIYDTKTGTSENLRRAFAKKNITLKNTIESITIQDGQIWVFNRFLASYSKENGVTTYEMPPGTPNGVKAWFITFDSAGNLWICTNHGLYVKYKSSNSIFKCLEGCELENENIFTCSEDRNGQIWIGTAGEGAFIYHPENDTISSISDDPQMGNMDIYSIVRSQQNEIWFSSNKGVFHYSKNNTITQYSEVDGLSGVQFTPNAGLICSNGKILFGALNGYNIIDPNIVRANDTKPEVLLSKILINNSPLSLENCKKANSLDNYNLQKLTLKHSQNTISLDIINNNYISPSKNKFKYRLINYNDNWTETNNGDGALYTKVPSGTYTFEAYGANNDGIWSDTPYRLKIRILPTPWMRWYAVLFYLCIIVTIVYLAYKNLHEKIALKKSFIDEKERANLNDSIHQERVKFFVNISHELRTPLSLILSPVRNLLNKYEDDENTTNLLKTIDRNSKRLLRLADQTLDFRLLEMGKLKPQLKKTDIIELSENSYTYFEQRILEKGINFVFDSDFKFLPILIDGDMIEKIMFNLVSNAIDFTPKGGTVEMLVRKKKITDSDYDGMTITGQQFIGNGIEILIRDSGIGIEDEKIEMLFQRFTKVTEDTQSKTGIGLHLCSEYATLNDGNIIAKSTIGEGSTFVLNLPIKDETELVTEKQKHIISHTEIAKNNKETEEETIIETIDADEDKSTNTILIVDSNKELILYMKKYLNKTFRIVTAHNTVQAMKILKQIKPSMIITEINFPTEEDYTCIESIKKENEYSGIPMIVLTQMTEKKHQIKCLELEVDAYLNKPIEDAVLLAQIKNLLKKETKQVVQAPKNEKTQTGRINLFDNSTFTAVAEQVVIDNLQNPNFDAQILAENMEVSYSTLFRRIKKETDISATQFIRDTRLSKSVELLRESELSIDEIGTSVGFNSSSYFVRSFKKKYSQTPSEYRKGN